MNNIQNPSAGLSELAAGHDTYTTAAEIGGEAATEAPATSPFCAGVVIGATLTVGC
ncbi:LxmA leader domain family RiPP [Glutamicibacter sp. PS]|uniref:LxmA leader domain family RiPP n=1 Tax=Glutamicibacter TaxID=1742989 RepID=UPI0028492AF9|nr:LxmA leader domain family RiPP [Glutamicibacter sp. PS]MDR4533624.1 LxmA leader domain family RiPP [Glutamicibacter sp. PS]